MKSLLLNTLLGLGIISLTTMPIIAADLPGPTSGLWEAQIKHKESIRTAMQSFEQFWIAGDASNAANHYTVDAIFFAPGSPPVVGRENITALFESLMGAGITKVSLVDDEINVNGVGTSASLVGRYTLFSSGVEVDQGPFVFILEFRNNEWLIHRDIFNSSNP